jgi:hypothetical protein
VLSSEGRKEGTSRYDCVDAGGGCSSECISVCLQLDGEATTVLLSIEEGVSGTGPFRVGAVLNDMVHPRQS